MKSLYIPVSGFTGRFLLRTRWRYVDSTAHTNQRQVPQGGTPTGDKYLQQQVMHELATQNHSAPATVLALNIDEVGHNCWVLEVNLLGI